MPGSCEGRDRKRAATLPADEGTRVGLWASKSGTGQGNHLIPIRYQVLIGPWLGSMKTLSHRFHQPKDCYGHYRGRMSSVPNVVRLSI
jgi:hypothetical protein